VVKKTLFPSGVGLAGISATMFSSGVGLAELSATLFPCGDRLAKLSARAFPPDVWVVLLKKSIFFYLCKYEG